MIARINNIEQCFVKMLGDKDNIILYIYILYILYKMYIYKKMTMGVCRNKSSCVYLRGL